MIVGIALFTFILTTTKFLQPHHVATLNFQRHNLQVYMMKMAGLQNDII